MPPVLIKPEDEPAPERFDRRKLAVLLLLLLLFGVGYHFYLKREDPGMLAATGPVMPIRPPGALLNESPGESHLYQEPGSDDPLSFGQFFELLGSAVKEPGLAPLAEDFKNQFQAEPELKRTYEDFKARNAKGEDATATAFLQELRQKPEFQRLMSRFGAQAGAESAVRTLAGFGELKPFLKQLYRNEVAGKPRGPGGARAGFGGLRGGSSARGVGGTRGPKGYALSAASGIQAQALAAQTGGGSQANPKTSPAEPGAHEVDPKLDKEWGGEDIGSKTFDGSRIEALLKQYPCLDALGKENIQRLDNGSSIESLGLWGACFETGMYGQCKMAGCPGISLGCWQSCLDAFGPDELGCIGRVRVSQGTACTVPADVPAETWDRLCIAPTRLRPPQAPPIECGLAPGPPIQCVLRDLDPTSGRPAWTGPNGEGGRPPGANGQCTAPATEKWTMPDGRVTCYVPGNGVTNCPAWGCQGNRDGLAAYERCLQAGGTR